MNAASPPLLYQQTFKIRSFDVDFQRRLRPDVLCSFFQEVASEHALILGVGYKQLEEQQMFWVLSRLLLHIQQLPRWEEEIKIETWAKGTDRLFALRDFKVINAHNEILCNATSYWLMLDAKSHRPVRPEAYFTRLKYEQHAIDAAIEKLEGTKDELAFTEKTKYADMDHNQHVNNIRYVSWMLNCFPLEFYHQHDLEALQLNFQSELKEKEIVEIYKQELLPEEYLINGYREDDELPCFSGKLKWKLK